MSRRTSTVVWGIVSFGFVGMSQMALGANWDESVNGDLSNNRFAPTTLALGLGSNTLKATSASGDREFVTINVPAGTVLSQIVLASWAGTDQRAFLAVQQGLVFTEDPAAPNVANMLGWTHFGPADQPLGSDILDNLGAGPGSIGFTPPLPSNDYTFWFNQTGGATTYQLDFVVVPTPGSGLALGAMGFLIAGRRRRT